MNGDRPFGMRRATATALLTCLAALGLLAASAQAATVTLRCAGRGPRNRDSANTVLCAGLPGSGRTLAGVVRDDTGRPVAARLAVTYSDWIPANGGYVIRARETKQVAAKADGSFSFRSNPATKESIRVDVVADATLGVSGGAFVQAEVSRLLVVRIAKLGGGVLRFTVTGTTHRPLKVWVLDSSGYPLSGIKPKKVDGRGQATFNLASLPRGYRLTYYVDAGDTLNDLFWYQSRVPFKA